MPIQYPTFNVRNSQQPEEVQTNEQFLNTTFQLQNYSDQDDNKEILLLKSQLEDKNEYIQLLTQKYVSIITEKDETIKKLQDQILSLTQSHTLSKQDYILDLNSQNTQKLTPDPISSKSRQNTQRSNYRSPYSQKVVQKPNTPTIEKINSFSSYDQYASKQLNQTKTHQFLTTQNLEDTVFGVTSTIQPQEPPHPTHPPQLPHKAFSLKPPSHSLTQLPITSTICPTILTIFSQNDGFSLTILDQNEQFMTQFEQNLCQTFGLCHNLLFAQKTAGNTLFLTTSSLRKQIIEILQSQGVKYEAIGTVSAVAYGRVSQEVVEKIAEKFNFYCIQAVENGFEVQFEDKEDCQKFVNFGQLEAEKNGEKGLSVGLKI